MYGSASNITAPPPGPDHAANYLAPFSVIIALVVITSVARIYSRSRLGRLDWSDWTLIFSAVLTLAWFALDVVLYVSYGRGVDNYVYDYSIVGPIEVAMGIIYFWGVNIVRVSMCLMLLRLQDKPVWKWPLRILIIIQLCLIIVTTCVQLAICRPLSAVWDVNQAGQCLSPSDLQHYIYVYNAFNILSDVVISLMPMTFIYHVHRTRLEKVLLCGLMAAGLLATAAAVVNLATIIGVILGVTEGMINVYWDVLSSLQLFWAVVAANLPCLKVPVEGLLVKWGVLKPKKHAAEGSPESFLGNMTHGSHFAQQLDDLEGGGNRKDEKDVSSSGSATRNDSASMGSGKPIVKTISAGTEGSGHGEVP